MFHSYYLHEKHEHLKKENGETSIHGVFMMAEAASFNPGDNFITSEFIGTYENDEVFYKFLDYLDINDNPLK